MALKFNTVFDPAYGEAVQVAPDVLRTTARNPSPFTFYGTNSYIVGRRTLAIVDPGPDDEVHLATLLRVAGGRRVSHIFVSHTHKDHSPLAARLKAETGAVVLAEGPHRASRPLRIGETNPLDASADLDFRPDRTLADGEVVHGDGWAIETVLTPGHAANHAAFALQGTGVLFSGDHVMGWSTSIVAPPDGAMADYMRSLDRLIERRDRMLLPGHGGAVDAPGTFMRGLKAHRKMRERAILERLRKGDRTISQVVASVYRGIDPRLHAAAGLSVLAHLEDLVARGIARSDAEPALDGIFELV